VSFLSAPHFNDPQASDRAREIASCFELMRLTPPEPPANIPAAIAARLHRTRDKQQARLGDKSAQADSA
jgi:hypothetical protein